jgi:hypothetical protein
VFFTGTKDLNCKCLQHPAAAFETLSRSLSLRLPGAPYADFACGDFDFDLLSIESHYESNSIAKYLKPEDAGLKPGPYIELPDALA